MAISLRTSPDAKAEKLPPLAPMQAEPEAVKPKADMPAGTALICRKPKPEKGEPPLVEPKEDLPPPAPMRGRPVYVTEPSGERRLVGVALRDMTQLEIMVERARQRHEARGLLNAKGEPLPFVPPFTSGQISVARAYRDLVEWREGSALRCASMETGRAGGGGSGLFIDSYIENGRWLEVLRERIGEVVVMDIRRHMDRGNTRRAITARDVVDEVVLSAVDVSVVLSRYGWSPDTKSRKALRLGLSAALDRMSGSVHPGVQAWQDEAVRAQQKGY